MNLKFKLMPKSNYSWCHFSEPMSSVFELPVKEQINSPLTSSYSADALLKDGPCLTTNLKKTYLTNGRSKIFFHLPLPKALSIDFSGCFGQVFSRNFG